MEEDKLLHKEEKNSPNEESVRGEEEKPPAAEAQPKSAGGWGWGFSAFSVLSDLHKAAEEVSRNAAAVAEKAAKSIVDLQEADEDSGSASKEEAETGKHDQEQESVDEKENIRKSALDKLENASEDSLLSQGLKVFDNSVENIASGAWQALGNVWKGGTNFVQKLEHNIQQGGGAHGTAVAPSLLETGKAFTAKGMQVLEYVGKETMDLLITETGIEVENDREGSKSPANEDHLYEEVTFDRCFYIYGGPEQLEELEALSSHYALLFNRRKAKLSLDQKSLYEGKFKQIQKIFSFASEMAGSDAESNKGKKVETRTEASDDDMKNLHDSSVSKAADMAAGFANALAGLNVNDMIQRTSGRLESLHSEGVHGVSEMCCFAVTHLLLLGKSIISHANKVQDEDTEALKIEWPEEPTEKARLIRSKAESMTRYIEAVSNSFITGIADVAEAYLSAIKTVAADANADLPKTSTIQEKASNFTNHLQSDHTTAVGKICDGLRCLSHVVISTSMPSA